ncbi:uncharacterized protein LOC133033895 [Cannabis sativa]|uniref:uncharacterized protein LOC133033895 n=1 Tax=Cannabis sativa TaxID=3483 RepID=UPI0029CA1EDA|nr:uncharacterized protein LOC133033895 [Cannabis sativa]
MGILMNSLGSLLNFITSFWWNFQIIKQYSFRRKSSDLSTARICNPNSFQTFPKFEGKNLLLTNDFEELQIPNCRSVMYYKKLPYCGQCESRPMVNQKVTIRCTIYDQKQNVKKLYDDVKIDLVIGNCNKHKLGEGLDFAIRTLRVYEEAIFVIPKASNSHFTFFFLFL